LPHIPDILDGLAGQNFFARLDLVKGFWQFPLDAASRHISAFRVGHRLYQWTRVPMGISPAPFYLQRTMHQIFAEHIGGGVFIYLDDIVVYGKTKDEFLAKLRCVLELVRKHNLRLKADKSIAGKSELPLLGYVVSGEGVRMGRDRISAVLAIPHPKTAKELRRFLGTTNYMRRFIPNYADIVKPLTSLVNSNNKALNTEAARAAFQRLLVVVDNQLSLRHVRYDLPIVVYTGFRRYTCERIPRRR